MFIQTQSTPNPETLKFLPGRTVTDGSSHDFTSPDLASRSPLASAVFAISGVRSVFLGSDFIAVTKDIDADWSRLKAHILATVMDHFMSGSPVLLDGEGDLDAADRHVDEETYDGEVAEIVAEIKELIATRVRPSVAQDGGDIVFKSFDANTGVVQLSLRGACSGCPSSIMTLKQGVENLLRHYVPEITAVEAAP
ncbi:MAG: NifU family protein [Alphaproteobacteria bacterium]|nr:NifU family protein [Alphaproteobacteria bacterium]